MNKKDNKRIKLSKKNSLKRKKKLLRRLLRLMKILMRSINDKIMINKWMILDL